VGPKGIRNYQAEEAAEDLLMIKVLFSLDLVKRRSLRKGY
jgi:hypothetical protein